MNEISLQAKYFSYQGRINRKRYIFSLLKILLVNFLIVFVIDVIALFIGLVSDADGSLETLSSILGGPFTVAWIMLSIKRWHDTNHSGWWFFIGFIPIINLYSIYMLYFKKGTEGPNDFGEDPLRQW